MVGNALEVTESVDTLKGRGPSDLEALSIELAAWMVHLGGKAEGLDAARAKVRESLRSGAGLRKFQEVIALQGGDPRVCDDTALLPRARETVEVRATAEGRVTRIACRAVGHAAMLLGAGRETVDSRIDPAVGIVLHKKVGDPVVMGEPIATVHVNERARRDECVARLTEAIRIGPEAPPSRPLVRSVLA